MATGIPETVLIAQTVCRNERRYRRRRNRATLGSAEAVK